MVRTAAKPDPAVYVCLDYFPEKMTDFAIME